MTSAHLGTAAALAAHLNPSNRSPCHRAGTKTIDCNTFKVTSAVTLMLPRPHHHHHHHDTTLAFNLSFLTVKKLPFFHHLFGCHSVSDWGLMHEHAAQGKIFWVKNVCLNVLNMRRTCDKERFPTQSTPTMIFPFSYSFGVILDRPVVLCLFSVPHNIWRADIHTDQLATTDISGCTSVTPPVNDKYMHVKQNLFRQLGVVLLFAVGQRKHLDTQTPDWRSHTLLYKLCSLIDVFW